MYLSNKGSLADQFVAEVEAEFNALRALSGSQDGEFERDLAALDAKTLYEVTIRDLWKKYLVSHTMQKAFPELYRMLVHEANWMKQHTTWQEAGPSLEDLLAGSRPVQSFSVPVRGEEQEAAPTRAHKQIRRQEFQASVGPAHRVEATLRTASGTSS